MRLQPAYVLLVAAGVFWGVGFPLGKLGLSVLDAPHMILLRQAIAAIACLPVLAVSTEARRLLLDPWTLAAGSCFGLGFVLQFAGLEYTTVSVSALVIGLMPALIAVVARAWGERLGAQGWAGVGAATAGAALIALRPGPNGATPVGLALTFAALALFIGWIAASRRIRKTPDLLAEPAAILVVSALAVAAIVLPLRGPPRLSLPPAIWASVVAQGLVSAALATACWQIGSARVPATTAGVFINVEPLVGASAGVLVFRDPVTAALLAGGALILAGSVTVVRAPRRATAAPLMPFRRREPRHYRPPRRDCGT